MADEPTPSVSGSVTPTPTTPVIGTSAPASVMQQTPPLSVEELTKRLAELEHSLGNAKEENDRHSKRLSAYEKAEKERAAAEQAAKDAERSEIDRVKQQATEAEQQLKQYQQLLLSAQVQLAAQSKGIIDPEMAALAIGAQLTDLEYGREGTAEAIDKALDKLLKSKPYLAAPTPAAAQPTSAQTAPASGQQAPAIPAWNISGRSSIPAPNTTPAFPKGTRPSLAAAHEMIDRTRHGT